MYVSLDSPSAQATSALSSAQTTLHKTQKQMSTGKAVNEASDNAALWAMATANYSDASALSAMSSSQTAGAMPLADSTQSAVNSVSSALNAMRDNLISAQNGGDQNAILASLQAQGQALKAAVSGAGLNGVNLLDTSTAANGSDFLLGYSASGETSVHVAAASLIDASGTTGALQTAQAAGSSQPTDLTAITANDISPANVAQTLSNLNVAQAQVQTVGAGVGGFSNMVGAANAFAAAIQINLANSAAAQDNADIGQVATQLSAANVRQQLATLGTSITHQSSASVLQLFKSNNA